MFIRIFRRVVKINKICWVFFTIISFLLKFKLSWLYWSNFDIICSNIENLVDLRSFMKILFEYYRLKSLNSLIILFITKCEFLIDLNSINKLF